MYLGQMVEKAPSDELFNDPVHPYTQALLSAIPVPDVHHIKNRILLQGEISSPFNPAPGCRFAARCNYVSEECRSPQVLEEVNQNHFVFCCKKRRINK